MRLSCLICALAAAVAFVSILAGAAAAQTDPYRATMAPLRKSPEKYQAWRRHLQDPGHHETVQGCIASATATTITVVPRKTSTLG